MNNFPNSETVVRIRSQYPAGTRVALVKMSDPYTRLIPGDEGVVTCVDDTGTIFVNWDKGEGLGIVFGEDSCRRIQSCDLWKLSRIKGSRRPDNE